MKFALTLAALLLLAGCGGSGGGSSPPPPPPPPPPPAPDTVRPVLAAVPNISPAVGASTGYVDAVTFTASEALLSASVTVRCTTVADGVVTPIAGTTSVAGAVVTFTPAVGYVPKDACVAQVASASDLAGNTWAGPETITTFAPRALDCVTPTRTYTYTGGRTISVCDNLFVDENGVRNAWPLTLKLVRDAQAAVEAYYGASAQGTVDFMFCGTPSCTSFYTAGINRPMYRAPGFFINGVQYDRAMVVNLGTGSASNLGTLTHEYAHGELDARVIQPIGENVPAWFDEGLATVIGNDRPLNTCAGFAGVPDLRALQWGYQWADATSNVNTAGTLYCQAQREVKAWLDKNGGATGLRTLIQRVNAGEAFYTVYGPLNY